MKRSLILLMVLPVLALAEPIKLRLPVEAVALMNALVALDGTDRVIEVDTKQVKVTVPFDFGKDAIRIRLTIREDLLALRTALEVYETVRSGHVKEVFGVSSMTAEEYARQPVEKQKLLEAKSVDLMAPTAIEMKLFTPEDVTAFAAAGVSGTLSVTLEPLVKHPKK